MPITDNGSKNTFEGSIEQGNPEIVFKGNNCTVKIGRNVSFRPRTKILLKADGQEIHIEDHAVIGGNFGLVGKNTRFIYGEGSRANSNLFANLGPGTTLRIGKGCLFADVRFRTHDSHRIMDLESGSLLNEPEDIYIEDKVWCAEGVLILKGVEIGTGSVVGARSTVTKSLPANSLCAGSPARVIRPGISWS